MRRFLTYGLLIAGIVIGSLHLKLATKALFVFRADEPTSMWLFVICGPLSTLPAVIISFFWPLIGSMWLICGSVLSFIAAWVNLGENKGFDELLWYFVRYSGPMLLLGIVGLVGHHFKPFGKNH